MTLTKGLVATSLNEISLTQRLHQILSMYPPHYLFAFEEGVEGVGEDTGNGHYFRPCRERTVEDLSKED